MGRASRDKGARYERELVQHLCQHGLHASRVPLSGAVDGYADDVLIRLSGTELRVECKRRARLASYLTQWVDGSADGLVAMREDRGRTLWLVSDELMVRLLQAVEANGGADE
jgi:Holliday junction resolvase